MSLVALVRDLEMVPTTTPEQVSVEARALALAREAVKYGPPVVDDTHYDLARALLAMSEKLDTAERERDDALEDLSVERDAREAGRHLREAAEERVRVLQQAVDDALEVFADTKWAEHYRQALKEQP